MKLLLPILLFSLAAQIAAAEFIVAPNGLDTNPGTLAAPFASLARAQQAVAPGDTVLIRGKAPDLGAFERGEILATPK